MPKSSRLKATAFAAARRNSVTSSGEPQPSVGSHARRHPVRFPLIYMSANRPGHRPSCQIQLHENPLQQHRVRRLRSSMSVQSACNISNVSPLDDSRRLGFTKRGLVLDDIAGLQLHGEQLLDRNIQHFGKRDCALQRRAVFPLHDAPQLNRTGYWSGSRRTTPSSWYGPEPILIYSIDEPSRLCGRRRVQTLAQ